MTKSTHPEEYTKLLKLQKLSSLLLSAKTIKEVADIIIDEGFSALGSICGDVALFDTATQSFNVLAKRGYPEKVIDVFHEAVKENRPLMSLEIIKGKKPIFIEDFLKVDKKYDFGHSFSRLTNSRSAVLLPLMKRREAFGTLQFNFRGSKKFTLEDKRFMLYLADQCAQALDRMIALENERQSKQELETILKGVGDGVIMRNARGEIIYVNPVALKMHGCKRPHELLHLNLEEYYALFSKIVDIKGNSLALGKVPFMEVTQERKFVRRTYYKVLKKNHEGHWYQITSLPIFDNKGVVEFIVSVMHDITDEKQNEYSKDEFFGIASHELKTPVTSLKAYTQVLKKRFEQEGNSQVAEFLQKMDYQIDKLTNLIRDLLDITKIEGGKLQFYNELFEFNSLAEEIVEEVRWTTEKHKIILEKTKDIVIQGDRERIGQVITNLLTNAIKYSPDNENISVKVEKIKNEAIFSVQDSGIGIAEKDQKHIFERFYREQNLKGDTFPGLGLGLYIASEIVKRQSGKIWVKSKKGEGSTFFFSVPLYKRPS